MRQAARVLGVLLMLAVANDAGGFLNQFFSNQAMLPEAFARPFIEDVRDMMERWAYEENQALDRTNSAIVDMTGVFAPGIGEAGLAPVLAGVFFDRQTDTYTRRFVYPNLSRVEFYELYQERLALNAHYTTARQICGAMKYAFDEGVRMVHVYQGRNGEEIFRVTLDQSTCARNPLISRTELQGSLERSTRYINANLGRVNAVNSSMLGPGMGVELVGVVFKESVWAYAFRLYDLENASVFSNETLAALQHEVALSTCLVWQVYLEAGYAVGEIYLDRNDVDLGAVLINEQVCRPYWAAAAQIQTDAKSRLMTPQ